jgi:hypothetical protein
VRFVGEFLLLLLVAVVFGAFLMFGIYLIRTHTPYCGQLMFLISGLCWLAVVCRAFIRFIDRDRR